MGLSPTNASAFPQPAGSASPPTTVTIGPSPPGGELVLPTNSNRMRALVQVPAGSTVFFAGPPSVPPGPALDATTGVELTAPATNPVELVVNNTDELYMFAAAPVTLRIYEERFGTQ